MLQTLSVEDGFSAELSLQEAINIACENNPELKSQDYSFKAVESQKRKAYGGFLPQVGIDINNGSQSTKVTDGAAIKGRANKKSLSLSQDIFNGGATYFDIKRAGSAVKKEKAVRDSKEQEIFLNVIQSYINILRYEDLLKIEEENLASQKKMLVYLKKKLKAKDATKSEYAKANANYVAAVNGKISTQNNLASARNILARLVGVTPSEIGKLKKISDEIFYEKLSKIDIKLLYEIALRNNPEVKIAKYSMDSAKHKSSMAKSSLSPSVKVTFSTAEERNPLYYNNTSYRNHSAYLNLHVPIFNSGIEYSNISETRNLFKSQKYNLQATKNEVKQRVMESFAKIKSLYAGYESSKEQEIADELYVESLSHEERLGTKSTIDLLEAKKELYRSKLSKGNAYYDKILEIFNLKSLAGELVYRNLSNKGYFKSFFVNPTEISKLKKSDVETVKNTNLKE